MRRNETTFVGKSSCLRWLNATIRAWHYTRLTDDETALLQAGGVYISNLEAIRRRLDVQVFAARAVCRDRRRVVCRKSLPSPE